jgi:hypothetical protein
MNGQIALEIPESVTTHFLVATNDAAPPGTGYVRDLLSISTAGSLAVIARDLLESPLLYVKDESTATSDWRDRLRGVAGVEAEVEFVLQASHHVVVTSVAAPAAQPRHAQAARLVARLVAAATSGVAVDLAANHAFTAVDTAGTERDAFVLGDDWLATFVTCDDQASEPGRVRVETAGLRRFGLPDLTMRGVQFASMLTAVNIVRALAFRLVTEHWNWLADHPREPVRRLDRRQCAAGRHLWSYWGARPLSGDTVWVRLDSRPNDPTLVEVSPAGNPRGDDWWTKVAAPAMPMLTSPPGARQNGTGPSP